MDRKQPPRTERIASWSQFMNRIEDFLDGGHVFRGVSSTKLHRLIPSVGRGLNTLPPDARMKRERQVFERFRREIIPHLPIPGAGLDLLDWLAIAQHHGVPTRLIDWTESPLVAAHFAFASLDPLDSGGDPGMFVLPLPPGLDRDRDVQPFEVDQVSFLYSGHVSRRIAAQKGLFTIHPDPVAEYDPDGLFQFVFDGSLREEFLRKLDSLGFNHGTIWDDIDGVCRHLAWVFRRDAVTAPMTPGPGPGGSGGDDVPEVPNDPQKHRWGKEPERNGWKLSATVVPEEEDWFRIKLKVGPSDDSGTRKLEGPVVFHLHDSFPEPRRECMPESGTARLRLWAYGAFTVGAQVTQDGTTLELDLAKMTDSPEPFRSR